MIGLEGEQLGIKPLKKRKYLSDSANVDLVLIQPQNHSVAKIMDYGKFKFEYQKKQKEQRKQSVVTVKETSLSQLLTRVTLTQNCTSSLKETKLENPFALKGA